MIHTISICQYHLIIISSSSPFLTLSPSLCFPLQPSLRCLPNDFHYFSVCYLLFNNHVSRMCMYIHRQFSAVVMGKSITPSSVCVCVCRREEMGYLFCGVLTESQEVIVSSRLCSCECVCRPAFVCIWQFLIIRFRKNCKLKHILRPVFKLHMTEFVLKSSEINTTSSQFTCEAVVQLNEIFPIRKPLLLLNVEPFAVTHEIIGDA